jgi:uncharacterized protein YciI
MTTVALLRRGPAWQSGISLRDQPTLDGHRAYIVSLVLDGTLESAGPFCRLDDEPDDLVGLVVFRTADADEARRLLGADPALSAGALVADVTPWYR